jgi:hypothetical protein
LGSNSCLESVACSSDEDDVEETDNPYYGLTFDAETVVDCMDDLQKLNLKEINSVQINL